MIGKAATRRESVLARSYYDVLADLRGKKLKA